MKHLIEQFPFIAQPDFILAAFITITMIVPGLICVFASRSDYRIPNRRDVRYRRGAVFRTVGVQPAR